MKLSWHGSRFWRGVDKSHGLYRGSVYPLIYTFMTRCKHTMYQALFSFIAKRAKSYDASSAGSRPSNFTTDFEIAAIKAFKAVFPRGVVTGCHFHLGQSVMRKVNKLGLKMTYRFDPWFSLLERSGQFMRFLSWFGVSSGIHIHDVVHSHHDLKEN